MMVPRENWQQANEDTLSTGSGSGASDSETNNTQVGGARSSEYIPLRFPHVRRMIPDGRKQKAVITSLALTILIISCTLFGIVYYSGGDANGIEHKTERRVDRGHDHEIVLRDLDDPNDDDTPAQVKAERRMSSDTDHHGLTVNGHEIMDIQGDAPVTASSASTSQTQNTTRRSKKKSNRNRNRNTHSHGPRPLPANAADIPAFSLLYQMRLAHGGHASFVHYTKCEETDLDNRKLFKGWKAVLTVNLTGAGLTAADHPSIFTGYGRSKNDARGRAAETAFATLYPDRLQYAGKDDFREIDEFCPASVEVQVPQTTSGSNTTITGAT